MGLKPYVLLFVFCLIPTPMFSNTLYFPQMAFGGGYTTTIVLMNMGTTTVSSDFQVFSESGVPLKSIPTTIPGAGSTRIRVTDSGASIISSWGMLDAGTGTVQGVATFDVRSITGALTNTAGVLGVEAANDFTIPVEVTENGTAFNTGFAIANVHPTNEVTIALQLISESGSYWPSTITDHFITLGSRQHVAEFVTSIWPQLAVGFRGTLLVGIVHTAGQRQPNSLVVTALTVKDGLLSAVPAISGDRSCFGCWDY